METIIRKLRFLWKFQELVVYICFLIALLVAVLIFEKAVLCMIEVALFDLLGNVSISGIRWAIILSVSFCSSDIFLMLSQIWRPKHYDESHSKWYIFFAWLIKPNPLTIFWLVALAMNTWLIWWAESLYLLDREVLYFDRIMFLYVAPILVAGYFLFARILLMSIFSVSESSIFSRKQGEKE